MCLFSRVAQIVSGGQSGVDRAALDVAISLGMAYRGWCPQGGWAEDMPEPPGLLLAYPDLTETPTADPEERTRWNVRDSDATVIVTAPGAVSAGTAVALCAVFELDRELAVIDAQDPARGLGDAREMLASLDPGASVNFAGPRESESPGIYARTASILASLLGGA